MLLPKPEFNDCSETSLILKWAPIEINGRSLYLQYKEAHLSWNEAFEIKVPSSSNSEISLQSTDIVDLKPGTPYSVRLSIENGSLRENGPEVILTILILMLLPRLKLYINTVININRQYLIQNLLIAVQKVKSLVLWHDP